ncbi:hypothetical protein ACFFRR_005197 [Megaselia abdita]
MLIIAYLVQNLNMTRDVHFLLLAFTTLLVTTLTLGETRQNLENQKHLNGKHLCQIDVPHISLPFYKHARIKQKLQHFTRIEYCCDGYIPYKAERSTDFVCLPKCDNCNNGFCKRPGVCVCYDGFVKNDDGDCVFSCPISCLNGQCYLDGTCRCNRGFKLSENRDFCRPICTMECGVNQNCTAPETCSCSKGFTLTKDGCTAVCNPKCGIGGQCVAPNVCYCHNSKFKLKNGVCQANCYQ